MALWLLLASLALACPGGLFSASEVTSGWPKMIKCRSPQMETFTCYWSFGGFNNRSDHVKLQYRTSDTHWMDCPDKTSGGENSCFFNKEHVSVQSNYSVRLVSENSTSRVYHFALNEIVEPNPPVALGWSLQNIDVNNSLLNIHIIWEPPHSSTIMLFLEYEVQIKEATEEQWKSYDVVTTTYLPVYGLKVGKKYLLRIHCRLFENDKFGGFSEELVIPLFFPVFKSKDPIGWPRITQCHSQQLETFTCHWTHGRFENLSGSLKLQYMIPGINWTDCPDTVSEGENSCYFSKEHTSIWVGYLVRLVSGNITFDEYSFAVSDIVDTTAIPRSSSAVHNRGPLLRDLKKTYPSGWPSITYCRSPQLETFTCYWTYGDFHNLSDSLKLQYMKPGINWTDCHDTVSEGENSCYFSKEHTSIWVGYLIRLVSGNITFDEYSLTVDDIVTPDPPISLNWTVLNVSATRLRMDIELTWNPPASADVKSGWMTLEYEIQLKVVNETEWKTYVVVSTPYSPIYGMKIGKEYMLRVRCRQKGFESFGEFSEVLVVPTVVNVEPDVPWPLFIVIGIFTVLMVLAFIFFCKKKRLKMLILPPVPVPKIKGIDPILLQKGKLDEVSSILASHDSYKQQLCSDDPWVEFIELDLDDQEEKNEGTDTDRLLGEEFPKANSCLAVKDDDSGRASCCEPDIPETDFGNSDMSNETSDTKDNQADLLCLSEKSNSGGVPTNSQMPNTEMMSTKPENGKVCPLLSNETSVPATTHLNNIGSKPSMDFYALVSDITPAGRLLLSPGQRIKMENEECNEPVIQQSPNLSVDNSYVCDTAVMAFCAMNFPVEASQSVQQNPTMDSYFTPESLTAATMSSRAAEKASSYETPVADYTSVHIINSPQNLVLNTTAPPGKEFPQPCGYMSTDQVNKVMP